MINDNLNINDNLTEYDSTFLVNRSTDKSIQEDLFVKKDLKKYFKISEENIQTLSFKDAILEISNIAFPTIFLFLCVFLQQTINLIFIGNSVEEGNKKDALNGIGISHLYINCSLVSIVVGLISGFETTGSNAYGAKKYYLLGLYYHRAMLIGILATIVLTIFHLFFATKILGFFDLGEGVMRYIDEYIYIMMFFVIFDLSYSLNFRFFNIIGKSHVNMIFLVISLSLHPLWCYLFIIVLDLNIQGAAISLVISQSITALGGIFYLLYFKPIPEAIFFFNKDSFKGWWEYLKIAFPSAILMCSEWWAYEIMAVIAIWVSKLDYTVHILVSNLNANVYAISAGFGMAANIIVGKSICENNINITKKYASITYFFGLFIMAIVLIIVFFLRNSILYIFIDEEDVIQKGINVIKILVLLNLFDYTQTVFGSVCKGLAKQLIASLVTIINFYIVQTSMAILFGKYLEWGVEGIWFGSFIGCTLCAILFFILITKFNFDKIQDDSLLRIYNETQILTEDKTENLIDKREVEYTRNSEF